MSCECSIELGNSPGGLACKSGGLSQMWILNQDYRNPALSALKLCLEIKPTSYPCSLYFVVITFRPYEIDHPCPGTPSTELVVSCGYRSFGASFFVKLEKAFGQCEFTSLAHFQN